MRGLQNHAEQAGALVVRASLFLLSFPVLLRRAARKLGRITWESDTSLIRLVMALSSVGYAAGLLPFLHSFQRPPFAFMRLLAPEWVWGSLLLLHAAGVVWRLIDSKPNRVWGFVVNAFGLALWMTMVALTLLVVGEYSPNAAMEITVMVMAGIALVRTGLNDERCTP